LIEVADRQYRVANAFDPEWQELDRGENIVSKDSVERAATATQHTAAKHVQQAVDNMKTGHRQRQTDEERHALCRQHAIVDNNQVKGPRKRKRVNKPG
jgi:hypothetical protein